MSSACRMLSRLRGPMPSQTTSDHTQKKKKSTPYIFRAFFRVLRDLWNKVNNVT